MKIPVTLLLFVVSVVAARAGIHLDVVAVPQAEITKGSIPVICNIARKEDGSVVLKLTLKEPFGVAGEFIGYELRVLSNPVSMAEVKRDFFNLDLIARREGSREKVAEFVLRKGEIPNSYLVVTSALGQKDGMANWRSLCVSVPALVAR